MVDQTLLPFQGVLNECFLQNLSISCHISLLEFSLHGLNIFCESSLNDWTTVLNSSDLPAFLYCSPETYLIFLTDLLSLRFTHDERPRIPLQVWESALKIVYRFFGLIQFALNTEQFPRIYQFFTVDIKKYGIVIPKKNNNGIIILNVALFRLEDSTYMVQCNAEY